MIRKRPNTHLLNLRDRQDRCEGEIGIIALDLYSSELAIAVASTLESKRAPSILILDRARDSTTPHSWPCSSSQVAREIMRDGVIDGDVYTSAFEPDTWPPDLPRFEALKLSYLERVRLRILRRIALMSHQRKSGKRLSP